MNGNDLQAEYRRLPVNILPNTRTSTITKIHLENKKSFKLLVFMFLLCIFDTSNILKT